MHLRRGKQGPASTIGMGVAPAPGLTKEALINPSRIVRAAKTKKCDFSFSFIFNGMPPLRMSAPPCAEVLTLTRAGTRNRIV